MFEVGSWRSIRSVDLGAQFFYCLATLGPDAGKLAVGKRGDPVAIYDVPSGREEIQLSVTRARYCALAFRPDGKGLAIGWGGDRDHGDHLNRYLQMGK